MRRGPVESSPIRVTRSARIIAMATALLGIPTAAFAQWIPQTAPCAAPSERLGRAALSARHERLGCATDATDVRARARQTPAASDGQ